MSRFDNQGVKSGSGDAKEVDGADGARIKNQEAHGDRKRLGRETGGVEFLRSCSRSLYHIAIKTASRASPLYNRFLYQPPRCKLGPFVTWYLMEYYCHTRLGSSHFACEIFLRILLARLIRSAHMNGDAKWSSGSTFAGFPTFCPMTFHLLASYSLIAASKAAL